MPMLFAFGTNLSIHGQVKQKWSKFFWEQIEGGFLCHLQEQ